MSQNVIDAPPQTKGSLKVPVYFLSGGYVCSFIGQYFRYMHWPFAGLLIYGGLLLLLIGIILSVSQTTANKQKEKRYWALLHWSIFLGMAYCVFRAMYYENMSIAFFVAIALMIAILYLLRKQLVKHKLLTAFNVTIIVLSLFLHITPRHKVYYFFTLSDYEKIKKKYGIVGSSPRLSFYSYLLYCDGLYKEALTWNEKALEQSYIDVKEGDGLIPESLTEKIKAEKQKITSKTWTRFE